MNRRSFLALFAGLLMLPKIKSQAIEFNFKSYDRNALIKYPLTPDQCYHIGVDPIGPPYGPYVVWESDPNGGFKKIGMVDGKTENGKLVWTKGKL